LFIWLVNTFFKDIIVDHPHIFLDQTYVWLYRNKDDFEIIKNI